MPYDFKSLTLSDLKGGLPELLFQDELQKVLLNIDDPNTKASAARSITLKFEFSPSDDRKDARITITAQSKLCPEHHAIRAFLGRDNKGVAYALENDPRQMTIEDVIDDMNKDIAPVRAIERTGDAS